MSLPKKVEKGYLEVERVAGGLRISGEKEHLDELALLYGQYHMPCLREDGHRGETLSFEPDIDGAKVEEILEAYKNAKGS